MNQVNVKKHCSDDVVVIGESVLFCNQIDIINSVNAGENESNPAAHQVKEMALKKKTQDSHHESSSSHN